jgi:hypothetical protein
MESSQTHSSAGLIIWQMEPKNLETPFDLVDSYLTPTELFYIRSHSDAEPERGILSPARRRRGETPTFFELRAVAKHAIRNAGRHPGVRR